MAKDDKTKRTTLGADINTSSAIGAYQDALNAQRNIRSNWDTASDISSDVMGGIQEHRAAVRLDEENKLKNLEAHKNQFANNVAKITENSGSLGEEYYGIATEQAKLLQEEYMNAVRLGDKEAQTKIKMKLQGFSTGVGSLKESLTIAAELQNDGLLSNGRTAEEIKIADICTNPANAIYQDGEWFFKDPDTGQMYTTEDLDKSLGQIDEVTSKAYLDYEHSQTEKGKNFINGDGGNKFDYDRAKVNIGDKFIKEDNIMSIMHDDFRRSGISHSFRQDLEGYLNDLGDDMWKTFNIDIDKDGVVDPEDKKAIVDAVTNKNSKHGFDFEVSKDIVAGYLAMHAEEKFYGEYEGMSLADRKNLTPDPDETEKEFIKRGGIVGLVNFGTGKFDESTGEFERKKKKKY